MEEKRQEEIERYLHNQMDRNELSIFEKQINSDKQLKEDVLLQIAIHDSFDDNSIGYDQNIYDIDLINKIKIKLKTGELKTVSNFIRKSTLKHKNKKIIKLATKLITSIAAIFLITFMIHYNSQKNYQSFYIENADWNNLPSLVEKGDNNSNISQIESLYDSQNYKQIISLINDNNKDPYQLIYKGVSYVKLNDFINATITFDKLINTNSLESSRGYWYKLLIYLNQNKLDDAKEILSKILQNKENYNYKKALELSNKLKASKE